MANTKSVAGYKIIVNGEYFIQDPNTGVKSIKFYKGESFDLPEIVTYVEGREKIEKIVNGRAVTTTKPKVLKGNASRCGLHIIRRYYIQHVLKEKYPGYTGVKTCRIFSKERIKMAPQKKLTPAGILKMEEAELRQFVILNDINIELSQFGDFGDMKNAVIRAYAQKQADDQLAGKTDAMAVEEEALLPSVDMSPADGIDADDPTSVDNSSLF